MYAAWWTELMKFQKMNQIVELKQLIFDLCHLDPSSFVVCNTYQLYTLIFYNSYTVHWAFCLQDYFEKTVSCLVVMNQENQFYDVSHEKNALWSDSVICLRVATVSDVPRKLKTQSQVD